MKQLSDFDPVVVRRLIKEEGWGLPLSEIRRVRLVFWQRTVFWGLRIYVVVMTTVVVWAFLHGAAG
jgi:hypothetical protein